MKEIFTVRSERGIARKMATIPFFFMIGFYHKKGDGKGIPNRIQKSAQLACFLSAPKGKKLFFFPSNEYVVLAS